MPTFSVPMEAHITADNRDDALAIAFFLPSRVADTDSGATHELHVATEMGKDVDLVTDPHDERGLGD